MRQDTRKQRIATDTFTFGSIVGDPTVGDELATGAAEIAELLIEIPVEGYQDTYRTLFESGVGIKPLAQAAGGMERIEHLDPRRLANLGVHFAESVWQHVQIIAVERTEKEAA